MKKEIPNKYKAFPFWSWNDKLDKDELVRQIEWMHKMGIGGFFMHARGGLTTEYLGDDWFECIKACLKKAKELNMEAYAYDENGWPSGFAGGKLLDDPNNHDMFLTSTIGEYDSKALVSYDISGECLVRVNSGKNVLNVFAINSASTADILNKEVVDKFIQLTHEEYKKNDVYGNLRGFFTDEPQYYRWATPYTRVLQQHFKDEYNEDLLARLGLLFVEKKGFRDFRYKYWKSMQSLMLKNYAENIYTWCDKNGYKLTGHYVEESRLSAQMWCCAGIMPFYEWEHIPGIDYLGRDLGRSACAKQLGSVASQLGKEQRMAEIFACTGWDATPNELRLIAEYCMVGGVNILCHHLLPYSEHGQRKRDYPEHFSAVNPWIEKDFASFNQYFAELGQKLAKSKEIANVGVLHPIRSAYFEYLTGKNGDSHGGIKDLDDAFNKDNLLFESYHLPFHYIDETILARHGSVDGAKLVVGKYKYDYIIIPTLMLTMDKTTEAFLHKYVDNGGKVLLLGEKPSYLEGNEFEYDYLNSNVSLDEIVNSQEIVVGKNDNVVCSYEIDENGKPYIYALNVGEATNVDIVFKRFKHLKVGDKVFERTISFGKFESKIIYPTNEEPTLVEEKNIIKLGPKFSIGKVDKNYIALDYISYSKDNKSYSKPYHYMFIFEKLLKERYQGELYLKYNVEIKSLPIVCFALVEDTNTKEVFVNGQVASKIGTVLEKDLWKYDVAKLLKVGTNEIIVKINMVESENVYYALFGENVTESLKNMLAYDTTIEPIYLQGDFGVYGDIEPKDRCFVGQNFYLDKPKNEVIDFIRDGFPFFRGEIELVQNIVVDDINSKLQLFDRFQLVDVKVNGKFVERSLFNTQVDLSKYLVKGTNEISLNIVVSNRNLLGPHHQVFLECFDIGPQTFERFKQWNDDGTSPACLDRYSFVKVI